MAKEISIALSISANFFGNTLPDRVQFGPITVDLIGPKVITAGTQVIGTQEQHGETLDLIDRHTLPGWCVIANMDATNYVAIGESANSPFAEMLPGEACLVRISRDASAIKLKANTAPVLVKFFVLET